MTLEARHVAAFLAIVDHGSVGRAAASLELTQPAVSRTLRQLETYLGVPLFERRTTGMALTSYGRALEPRTRLIAAETERAVEDIRTLRGLSTGTLKVGAVGSVLTHVLPRAIKGLLRSQPGLRVEITEGVDDKLIEALLDYEIDIAIGVGLPESDQVSLTGSLKWQDRETIVAATDHPLRKKDQLTIADLHDVPWVMPPPHTRPYDAFVQLFRDAGLEPPSISVVTRSVVAVKSLIAEAGHLAVMPQPLFAPERAAGTIGPLPVPGGSKPRRFGVFRRRHGYLPLPAEALVAELEHVVGWIQPGTRPRSNDEPL
ncbi:MAG: LysR family transcriptional regulator [Pseudonocardiaceae bacterium]|nr:LysR family transcriptional regulator [Pseudonocardiaceae bacterium]